MDIVVSLFCKGFRGASSYTGSHRFVGDAFYLRRVFPCHYRIREASTKPYRYCVEVENGDILYIRSSHLIAVPTFSFIDPALEGAKLEAVLARLSVIAGPGNETEWIDPRSPSLC